MSYKIAYISTYPPKKCGIASYTQNLRHSIDLAKTEPSSDIVIAVVDSKDGTQKTNTLWKLKRNDLDEYKAIAKRINKSDIAIVFLQHNFGIFGGKYGCYIYDLISYLKKPLITTFHTISPKLDSTHLELMKRICGCSHSIIVMNQYSSHFLQQWLGISPEKIICIPHGAPEPIAFNSTLFREQLHWTGKKVLLSFGLISNNKGFEFILNLLPEVIKKIPDCLYVIIGETHPHVIKKEGEAYRNKLYEIIESIGMKNYVSMLNKYATEEELIKYLMASDLVIIPYPAILQSSSGVLAYAIGLGKPLISTPFIHAQELLQEHKELLLPYGDDKAWSDKIIQLLSDSDCLKSWENKIGVLGRTIHWPLIGKMHAEILDRVNISNHP